MVQKFWHRALALSVQHGGRVVKKLAEKALRGV